MFDKLRSASRLSLTDWLLFFQAWAWLLLFDLGLRLRPFPELQALASRLSARITPTPEEAEQLLYTRRMAVDRARAHHLYPMTCLRRALALQKILAQSGIAAELRIGVRKESGQLSAHAWIEYQGQTLGEAEAVTEKFSTLEKSVNMGKGGSS